MNLSEIRFPLEGNVQNLVHFIDHSGNYAFTFGSPFCYEEPSDLREKKAFLLAEFNQMKKKNLNAESVFAYFINSDKKENHPDTKMKASVRESQIFSGDGTLLGKIDVVLQRGMFRSYKGLHPNPIYDKTGKLVGFCHYNPGQKCKDVYLCEQDFSHLNESLTEENLATLIKNGSIERIFSYDIVESDEVDTRDRFMAIFSPSKKSELTNNRLRFFGGEMDEELKTLLLTALFAFFWGTYIDVPM